MYNIKSVALSNFKDGERQCVLTLKFKKDYAIPKDKSARREVFKKLIPKWSAGEYDQLVIEHTGQYGVKEAMIFIKEAT